MSVGMPRGGDRVPFHQVCGWQQISGRAKMVKGRAATQRDSGWRNAMTRTSWNSTRTNSIWDRLTPCRVRLCGKGPGGPGGQLGKPKPVMKANSTLGYVSRSTARRGGKQLPSSTWHSDHIWNIVLFHQHIVAPQCCCRPFQRSLPPSPRKEEGHKHSRTVGTTEEETQSKATGALVLWRKKACASWDGWRAVFSHWCQGQSESCCPLWRKHKSCPLTPHLVYSQSN